MGFHTAALYDSIWLMVKSILETGSVNGSDIRRVLIPISHKHYGLSGWCSLDENGDRLPQIFNIWGLYKDPETGKFGSMKFGEYDGRINKATWDYYALKRYVNITPSR